MASDFKKKKKVVRMKEKLLPTDTKIKVLQDSKPIVSSHFCLENILIASVTVSEIFCVNVGGLLLPSNCY